jgi:hypothetical protein
MSTVAHYIAAVAGTCACVFLVGVGRAPAALCFLQCLVVRMTVLATKHCQCGLSYSQFRGCQLLLAWSADLVSWLSTSAVGALVLCLLTLSVGSLRIDCQLLLTWSVGLCVLVTTELRRYETIVPRVCVAEVDFHTDGPGSLPMEKRMIVKVRS